MEKLEQEIDTKIEPTPLKYNTINSGIKNILLIDGDVYQNEILYDSVNSNTLAIKYTINSSKKELEELMTNNFTEINRIGFAFNDALINSKQFLDNELFFTPDDLIENQSTYSSNLQFVIDLIKKLNVSNVDYLVCNGLKYDDWIKYFNILNKETGVIVGASDDETGNVKYGSDWVMETTNEDVVNIYWGELITNYTTTLATSRISTSITVTNAQLNNTSIYTWPITISGGKSSSPVVITFGDAITLNSTSKYFIIGSNYIIIEGNNNTVTINGVTNYHGLVHNGAYNVSGYSNITIQNINMSTSNSSTIDGSRGWICRNYFGSNSSANSYINNCSTDATCNSQIDRNTGLVCGSNANRVICNNCSSAGTISGGGIFGRICTDCQANNCFSTGQIGGYNNNGAGGIFASNNGNTNQAKNCYSTGNIYTSGSYGSGGICGEENSVVVSNCYSRGIIGFNGGTNCGGIFGRGSTGAATNCYSSGTINAGNGNGIGPTSVSKTNCYVANGSWSDSTASANLTGTPTYSSGSLVNPVGTVWADIAPTDNNVPWIFSILGYSPYTSILTTTFTQTIVQTQSTNGALNPTGHTYSIVAINDQLPSVYPTITIDASGSNGGSINTQRDTAVGTYNIKVMQNSDYSITNFVLTLNAYCYLETTKILCIIDGKETYKEIRDIKIGDTVKTYLHGNKKVIRKVKVKLQNNVNKSIHKLYKMSKELDDRLIDDLYVSGQHSILVDRLSEKEKTKSLNIWSKLQKIDDKKLLMACVSDKFEEVKDNKIYTLYQLVLESENKKQQYGIYSNGILSETMSESTFDRKKNMEKIFF
jgi:hypothetical protein